MPFEPAALERREHRVRSAVRFTRFVGTKIDVIDARFDVRAVAFERAAHARVALARARLVIEIVVERGRPHSAREPLQFEREVAFEQSEIAALRA